MSPRRGWRRRCIHLLVIFPLEASARRCSLWHESAPCLIVSGLPRDPVEENVPVFPILPDVPIGAELPAVALVRTPYNPNNRFQQTVPIDS